MSLTPGVRLGPYEVVAPAGAGGMGEVYRARDTRLDRTVALKVLPSDLAADPGLRERFEREARAIAALNHPHICTLHDVGREGNVDFLVMEFVEGETLAERLKRGALPIPEALQYAAHIADALDKAHRAGIVHRDLKPGNVMLTKAGAKLLDFGLAKAAAPPGLALAAGQTPMALASALVRGSMLPTTATPLTMEGSIVGTLQYMAPEQLEGRDADTRTDIFAFGAVLYEMVTGQRAFHGKSQVSLMAAIMDQEPPPLRDLQPAAPPLLQHLVRTCLAKNPDERWQHAGDVLIELKLITETGGEPAGPPPVAARSRWRERAGWAAAAVLLLATTALAAYTVFGRTPAATAKISFDVVTPPAPGPLHIAISPAGTHIVAVADEGGLRGLWLRTLEHREGQFLTRADNANFPFWAPDGRTVGFFSDGKLKTIDLLGAPPAILCDAAEGHGGTWNGDGDILFAPTLNGPLFRVAAAGGMPVQVTQLDAAQGELAHRHPFFLPDGDHFLYTAVSGKSELSGVYVGSLSSPDRRRLFQSTLKAAFAPPDHILFMRDNTTLLAQRFDPQRLELQGDPFPAVSDDIGINLTNSAAGFTASHNGTLTYRPGSAVGQRTMTIRDTTGAGVATVGAPAGFDSPALSPDAQRIAVARRDNSAGDIWIFDLTRGSSSRFTFDAAADAAPVWSPDSSRIVFSSNRGGTFDLFVKNAGGAGPEDRLFASDQAKLADDWSRDGRFLLYRSEDTKTGWDVWVLPLDGAGKPRPLVQTPFREFQGRFSPDGRWFAYVSNETGRDEVYVQSFPEAGGKWQVSTTGGVQPRWRQDGREMYFHSPTNDVMAVDINATPPAIFAAGVPRRLVSSIPLASRVTDRNSWDMSPDGRRFVTVSTEAQAAQATGQVSLTVVVNWLAGTTR